MSHWFHLDSGPGEPAFNMALDEALMTKAAIIGAPVLRLYGWSKPAATFGYFQKIADLEAATLVRPLVRRPTGGGLVPHLDDWTYSLVVPPQHRWHDLKAEESYARMHRWLQAAFGSLGVSTELAACCRREIPGQCFAGYEKFDLLRAGRKLAGAAQRRNKLGLLIQGSIQPPPRECTRAQFLDALFQVGPEWLAGPGLAWQPDDATVGLARQLEAERYGQTRFLRRR